MKKLTALLLVLVFILSVAFCPATATDINLDNRTSSAVAQIYSEAFSVIAQGLRNNETYISIKEQYIPSKHLSRVFESVIIENPDIFYVNPYSLEYAVNIENGFVSHIKPTYFFEADEIAEKKQKFNSAVEYYLSGVDASWSNYKKCRYIHDLLASTIEFDTDFNNNKSEVFTAYGALVDNVAISQGYALAYNYLMNKLGIEALYIENNGKFHSWSMVKLGENYYHVDVVGDDPSDDLLGRILHDYCLISDKKLKSLRTDFSWIADYQATNTRFDNAWWSGVDTFIFTADSKDYYIDNNYKDGKCGAFLCYEEASDSHSLLYKIEDKWYVNKENNQFWSGSFSSLAFDGNLFYFNTPDGVYSIKSTGKGRTLFYERPSSQKLDMFGIATLSDGIIYAEYREDPMIDGIVFSVDSKESIYKIGDVNTDGVTDIKDVTRLQKSLISKLMLSSKQIALADYNKDDEINVNDVTAMQKKLVNIR